MIEVKNLSKRYGSFSAVKNLNFTIPSGKIYGFLGPNGAGKSTTMNMITGYLAASTGEILVDGINMTEEPEKAKLKLGYLPEIPPLYTDMTVEEYLNFAAEIKQIAPTERQNAVSEVIQATALEKVQGRLIRNLSKGFKQRTGLAQAILGNPETIILDEPMVGLDPKQIIEIRELIRSLSKNRTVMLSSHILSEISMLCDHIMILNKGELIVSDTPENLEKRFATKGELLLRLKTNAEKAAKLLKRLQRNIFELKSEGQQVFIRCTIDNEEADCEAIFHLCAEENVPILQMTANKASLEEVFLELTEDKKEETTDDQHF